MVIELPFLSGDMPFPAVETALQSPNGLLAYGGNLSVNRLLHAYYHGIFPWYGESDPILWWSPNPRAIIELERAHFSKSLYKLARQKRYQITVNNDFESVIQHCASIPRRIDDSGEHSNETWITQDMQNAYCQLHHAGFAHSIEVWQDDILVGGLYGVAIGRIFCGESMFHLKSNTSKLAMLALVEHMKKHNLAFIDCQLPTPHLASLGAITLERDTFMARLEANRQTTTSDGERLPFYRQCWQAQKIAL